MEQFEKSTGKTLLGIYDDDLRRLSSRVGRDRAVNTLKSMCLGRKYLSTFLRTKMEREDIFLSELSPQTICDFSVWLSAERRLRGGTVWLVCLQLKGVVTRAHQRGLLQWNPFAGFRISKNIRPREYLTEEELNKLMTHNFDDGKLAFARDIFIFSAFTGLSFIDIKELHYSDIVTMGEAIWIVSRRHKTKIPYQVKLLDIPFHILQHHQQSGSEKVFRELEYRTLANRIKKVMEEIGIKKHITMHCARHSFAVLAINHGMPIESLSRILGHTNITTTQIYAKINMQKINSDMLELERQLHLIIYIGGKTEGGDT